MQSSRTPTDGATDAGSQPVPLLAMAGMHKSFAGVHALVDVALSVAPGEVHALLGENGAGKSTLMNIASGTLQPDEGTMHFGGEFVEGLTPVTAAELGIAIVHQHPALLPDMTVAENIAVGVPGRFLEGPGGARAAMRAMLDDVGFTPHLEDRVDALTVAQKHLLELAKALAVQPRLLILDEPTAPLDQEAVDMLFERVRQVAAAGSAVIYITHRLAEVRIVADRVTVLRDGQGRGTSDVSAISDDELLRLIIGRRLESAFPPKLAAERLSDDPLLVVRGLEGHGFHDIDLTARRGEIVGIAGVAGNGQSELLRALSGLDRFSGEVEVGGTSHTPKSLRAHASYMTPDRHGEGLLSSLTVRENTVVTALHRLRRYFIVDRGAERSTVKRELAELNTRAPDMEAQVTTLSGGNQQKVLVARALLSEPQILLADEPTQGVDVGARSEIYRILRDVSAGGVPVIVASSDFLELEGLCDRVLVMSRGACVAELTGDDVTEEAMINAAMRAAGTRRAQDAPAGRPTSTATSRFIRGDYAPVAVLVTVMVCLGAYIYSRNDRLLSAFNITSVMLLITALGLIALGQTISLLLAGIDLSVGPLSGFLVVVGSFFLTEDNSGADYFLGFLLMAVAAVALGLLNGSLIRFLRFTPVAATLATFIGLQGMSFVLRDVPGGLVSRDLSATITTKVGPVPLAFIGFVLLGLAMEHALRRTGWGLRLRAVGSDEESARKVGVRITPTVLGGYVITSLFVFLGSVMLLAQLGIGDPAQGEGYTISSIAAVVLGGTSLLGGRGSFIGTLFGAGLMIQVLNGAALLGLTQTWELLFQGLLIVAAAVVYSQIRRREVAA